MSPILRLSSALLITLFLLCVPLHTVNSIASHHHIHSAFAESGIFEHFADMTEAVIVTAIVLLGIPLRILFLRNEVEIYSVYRVEPFDLKKIRKRRYREWLRLHFTSPPV